MTLAQLKYIIAVAECGTISKAAEKLYISQPSLTTSIKDLESEFGIEIFSRTNKGVILTSDGEEFLGYARQVISQTSLMEEHYSGATAARHQFCVSTQHYSFSIEAFVKLLKEYGGEQYDFRIRETQTYEIIEDVAKLKSEVGVLYLNQFNETVLRKLCGRMIWNLPVFLLRSPMYLWEQIIRWQKRKCLRWRIWHLIPVCLTNRGITMPFIFRRRS